MADPAQIVPAPPACGTSNENSPRPIAQKESQVISLQLECSDPWFQDGNIIITTDTKKFRVYRGILAEKSQIFADMFSITQSQDQERIEGCPVVYLSDDSDDVCHALKALFDRSYYFNHDESLPFAVVAAFIRIGTKYDIHQLRNEGISRLKRQYPTTLDGLDSYPKLYSSSITHHSGLIFDAINLAQQYDILSILPMAFYLCPMTYPLNIIFEGIPRPDGTLATLTPRDQKRCLLGRQPLLNFQAESYKWLTGGMSSPCESPDCLIAKYELLSNYIVPSKPRFSNMISLKLDDKGLCSPCLTTAKDSWAQNRKELWQKLPSFYDLPPWEQLLATSS